MFSDSYMCLNFWKHVRTSLSRIIVRSCQYNKVVIISGDKVVFVGSVLDVILKGINRKFSMDLLLFVEKYRPTVLEKVI